MNEQYIERIIKRVFSHSEQLITRLLAERKSTGDYQKEVVIPEEGLDYLFVVQKHGNKYPAVKKNFCFSVSVKEEGTQEDVFTCLIEPDGYSPRHFGNVNRYGMLVMCNPLLCDKSHIKSLIHTGDSICLQKDGKVAFAKVEVLGEEYDFDILYGYNVSRKVVLTKELGHPETYAYEDYPNRVATYIGDEQTLEYFGDKETITGVLGFCLVKSYTTYNDVGWYWFEKEESFRRLKGVTLEMGVPKTIEEVTSEVRNSALKELLENCEGEFAYGDPRVRKYADDYAILGDELIEKIYAKYMLWLRMFSTTESEDGAECTGIAVRYGENQRPPFEAYLSSERTNEIAMLEALPSSMEEAEAQLPMSAAELEHQLYKLFGYDYSVTVLPSGKAYMVSVVDSDTLSKATFMIKDGLVSSLKGFRFTDVTDMVEEKRPQIQQLFK